MCLYYIAIIFKKKRSMIYPIVLYGDNVLREKCTEIKMGDLDIKSLVNDVFETIKLMESVKTSHV